MVSKLAVLGLINQKSVTWLVQKKEKCLLYSTFTKIFTHVRAPIIFFCEQMTHKDVEKRSVCYIMVYLAPLVLFFAANPSTLTLSLSLSSFLQSSWAFSLGVYSSTPLFQPSRIRHITPITCSSEGSTPNRLGFTRIDSTSSSITVATTTTTEATRSTTSRTTPTTTVPPPPLIMMTQQTTTSRTSTTTSSSCSSDTPTSSRYQQQKQKQQQTKTTIIYGIRHARSMSNEWMSQEGNQWGDATFRDDLSFVDSPLSPMGYDQTQALQERLLNTIKKKKQQQRRRRHHSNHKNSHHDHHGGDNNNNNNNNNNNHVMMVKNGEDDGSSNIHPHDDNDENTAQPSATDTLTTDNGHDHDDDDDDCFCFLSEIELVLISPLTRCLQTFEYGCRQALEMACHDNDVDDDVVDHSCLQSTPPIMAFPLATERVYTSAETGRPLSQLQTEFPNIDWSLFFENNNNNNDHPGTLDTNAWWYTGRCCRHEINQDDDDDNDDNVDVVDDNDNNLDFVEWRPYKQGQFYAVPGEPYIVFANRMEKLKNWIRQRPESKILLITHWGVLNHLSLGQQEDPCNTGICQLEI